MFKIFLKYYLSALVLAGIIFYFSSIPGLGYFKIATTEIIARKGAHFLEYAILSFLLWRIFYIAHKFSPRKAFFWALTVSIVYAISDEFHQTLVYGRTGKIIDVAYDILSSLFVLELIFFYVKGKLTFQKILIITLILVMLLGIEVKMVKDVASNEKKSLSVIFSEEIDTVKKDLNKRILGKKESKKEVGIKNKEESSNKEIEVQIDTDERQILVENKKKQKETPVISKIPKKIFIKTPFTSQAPFAKWDELHEDACEEASGIMLAYYLLDKKLTKDIAEQEIQNLVKFENEKFGDFKDTTAQETADIIEKFYSLSKIGKKLKVVYDFQKDDLKKYLAKGNPIIIPAAGRKLDNPHYTPPGPLYHNLVLVGYDGDTIIANDSGTKRGESYKYNIDILYKAIHDFPGDVNNIEKGRKAMIVVE